MPALAAGIAALAATKKNADGRNKSGHDGNIMGANSPASAAPRGVPNFPKRG
jgi:hypothetical protein